MKIALGIVQLFPEGGLQRDCVRLARILVARGHDVTIFTTLMRGPLRLPACRTVVEPIRAYTNHGVDSLFAERFAIQTAEGFDRVIGFNKLTGLQFLYCADPSVHERDRNLLERLMPRHRVQTMLERESFGPLQSTQILALTRVSADAYRRAWGTQEQRITVIDPSIDPARQRPDLRASARRDQIRAELGLSKDQRVWLWVGAQAQTKGLDRVLAALEEEPGSILLAAGVAPSSKEALHALRYIKRKAMDDRVRFLGFREDIPELMAAADLLLHPSRLDVTGQVILEAVVNGLPVVVSGICGFAEHVEAAGAGIVLPEPFSQSDFQAAIARMRDPSLTAQMSDAGIEYGRKNEPVTGLEQAADVIERGLITIATPVTTSLHRPAPAPAAQPRPYVPISVIVATYNRPDALDAVFRALARQSDKNFEVVVADDGSSQSTTDLLESWRPRLGRPLVHVWHEDRGFRLAESRNRAILASSGSYCIFLDGDCIARNDFIQAHRRLAETGWFVVGNRVLMSRYLTERTLCDHLEPELWQFHDFSRQRRSGEINRLAPLMHVRLGPARKLLRRKWTGARACNLAVWRTDLDQIDGFDASFVGWGLEDSDLLIRLLRAGVQRKDGRFATGVLHLWHPLADAAQFSANQSRLEAIQLSDRIRASKGMSDLQNEAPARALPSAEAAE